MEQYSREDRTRVELSPNPHPNNVLTKLRQCKIFRYLAHTLRQKFNPHWLNLLPIVKIQYAPSQNLNKDPTCEEIIQRVRSYAQHLPPVWQFFVDLRDWKFAQTEARPENIG